METMAFALVSAVFWLFTALVLGTVAMSFVLRRRFPDLWLQWGEPTEWLSLQRTTLSRHVFTFLDSRSYFQSNSPGFIRFCGALRLGWYVFFVLFVVALLILAAALASKP